MRALAFDINDAGIAVADDSGVLAMELGVAFVERGRVRTGSDARPFARLKPRQFSNRFWSSLSSEPGSAGLEAGISAAELAFAQLQALWQRFGEGTTDVVLVVPGSCRGEQLGVLLGLAQECGMPVRALVDAAVAASVRPYPEHQLLYLDAGLHRTAVTLIEQGADAAVLAEQDLAKGLATLGEAFGRRIAEVFVRVTRLDPFHHAETEQQIYDQLPGWLGELYERDSIECVLRHRDQEFRVTIERNSLLAVAEGFYRAVTQLCSQLREPGRSLVVQLSARLGSLPGFVTSLSRLDDAHVERLEPGHAARGALLAVNALPAAAEGIKLLKHLPWRAPAASIELAVRTPARVERAAVDDPPTHIVYRGVAYRVGAQGLVIGREASNGKRMIVVDDQSGGVSREHCELVLRDGELKVRDLSRYGTFVNEKRISGETALQRADVIRIGSPGAELQIVGMEPTHGA